MKIEQERGISVTSSVMTFEHQGIAVYNLLDTPGHEDFSEDTYRTLTAVDSAIMVIDAARGIETQTRKLFEVCRLRDIPIITFVNKVDREGRDPVRNARPDPGRAATRDLPVRVWPIGMGGLFEGFIRQSNKVPVIVEERVRQLQSRHPSAAALMIRKLDDGQGRRRPRSVAR
jgi:peptide chain release factor 3